MPNYGIKQMIKISTNHQAYTFIEIMLVIVILGILVGIALPNFKQSIGKSYEREALVQLTSIHAANKVYKAQTSAYVDGDGLTMQDINSALNLNIVENKISYNYQKVSDTAYTAYAESTVQGWRLSMNEGRLAPNDAAPNPCCDRDESRPECPSIADCS